MQTESEKGFFSKLFGRSNSSLGESDSESDVKNGLGSEVNSASNEAPAEVWLHPDSEHLKKQTLMQARKIEKSTFLIGRRTSETVAFPNQEPPDMLLFETSPYTLSKLQCQIEITEKGVIVRDLGSRNGTKVDDKRLISAKGKQKSLLVPKGSHTLILGKRDGPYRFRLEIV